MGKLTSTRLLSSAEQTEKNEWHEKIQKKLSLSRFRERRRKTTEGGRERREATRVLNVEVGIGWVGSSNSNIEREGEKGRPFKLQRL